MKIEVERVKKDEGDAFVTVLRNKPEETWKEKYGDEISPMDEIKKAKELMDAGAIVKKSMKT